MSVPLQKPGKSKQDYQTPKEFLDATRKLLNIGNFWWDLAADADNTVVPKDYYDHYFGEGIDSLKQDWTQPGPMQTQWLWLNPPYANIKPWAEKCYQSSQNGAKIAFLVPASVGANWYRDFIHNKAYVLFLNGRLAFIPDKPNWLYPKDLILVLYTKWAVGSNVWDWKQ